MDGKRLAKCSGPAYGYDPTSYRAEAYGLLSGLRFLLHLLDFFKQPQTCSLTCIIDNESAASTTLVAWFLNEEFHGGEILGPKWFPLPIEDLLRLPQLRPKPYPPTGT